MPPNLRLIRGMHRENLGGDLQQQQQQQGNE